MSTFIVDTLSPKGNFPVMEADDIILKGDVISVEDRIIPADDNNLGRVKVDSNIKLDNGEISLDPFLTVSETEPTDGSIFWLNENPLPEDVNNTTTSLLSTKYAPGINAIEVKNDGLYVKGYKGRIANVIYLKGYPITAYGTVNCYVDSNVGDDNTADGSAEKPFKTWEVARTFLPRNTQRYAIQIYFTGTFSTETFFEGFNCYLAIYMVNTPQFKCLRFFTCPRVYIFDAFKCTMGTPPGNARALIDSYSSHVGLSTTGTSAITIVLTGGSTNSTTDIRGLHAGQGGCIQVTSGYITVQINSCYRAILADYSGEVDIRNLTSSSNSYTGMDSFTGGVIRYNSKSNGASTAWRTGTGGRIYNGANSSYGAY